MRLLITGAWGEGEAQADRLREMGHEVCFLRQEKDPLPCDPGWPEGIVCNGLFLHHPIEAFTSLRYLQLTSAGMDRVDTEYLRRHHVEVHNARGVYSGPMAEFALAGVLSLYKRLPAFRLQQQSCQWVKRRDLRELAGRRVLILGCGSVGTECAKRFRAFGCAVAGIDLVPREDPAFDEILPLQSLDMELPGADILILTLPLTPETRHLIDARRLSLLRGVLVNLSRGAVIDQKALEAWGGEAVLDVFEEEPLPPDSPLWAKETFLITPHVSFIGEGNAARLTALILKNLEEVTPSVR